jgi:ADP-heptose:LPS heptosyltransferase
MSKKILIFRTDRIGDLIVSCPPILTIKEYLKDPNLTLVASNKNFDYAKSLNLFNEILLFPDSGIFNKIKFILKLRKTKFDCIYIFDGKEKSLILTLFLKSSIKVGISNEIKKYFYLLNIKIFEFNNNKLYDVFQKILHYSKIDKEINHYNFISKKKKNNFVNKIPINDYVQIHLDEKWISAFYISNYTDINPNYSEFILFLKNASQYNNILITTGFINFPLLDEIKKKFFTKLKDNIYSNNEMNHSIYFIDKPSFLDIESLMTKTKLLIICHGSLTHVANSFNIKIIDIIEESKQDFYSTYTHYISNYNNLFRSTFSKLRKFLINFIKVKK